MKKYIILLGFILGFAVIGHAQEFRLNLYSAYVFDDRFETYNSDVSFLEGKILGGYQWGVGLEYLPNDYFGGELLYLRQDTRVPVRYYSIFEQDRTLEASVNYILAGPVGYSGSGRAQGYFGALAGMAIYDNKNPEPLEPSSYTKFAWGVKLGGNIWASDNVGIKLQMQLIVCCSGYRRQLLFRNRRFRREAWLGIQACFNSPSVEVLRFGSENKYLSKDNGAVS